MNKSFSADIIFNVRSAEKIRACIKFYHDEVVDIINAEHCISSLRRSVYHQLEELHIIKPKAFMHAVGVVIYTASGDDIQRLSPLMIYTPDGVMIYQASMLSAWIR